MPEDQEQDDQELEAKINRLYRRLQSLDPQGLAAIAKKNGNGIHSR